MNLQSYVCGAWQSGRDNGVAMRDATTGEVIGQASSAGVDFAGALRHAREVGGPALRALTFHERGSLLKALAKRLSESKEEFYTLSHCTGATKNDSLIDIDGGIGTVFAFAGKASRELPNARVYIDGDVEGPQRELRAVPGEQDSLEHQRRSGTRDRAMIRAMSM